MRGNGESVVKCHEQIMTVKKMSQGNCVCEEMSLGNGGSVRKMSNWSDEFVYEISVRECHFKLVSL